MLTAWPAVLVGTPSADEEARTWPFAGKIVKDLVQELFPSVSKSIRHHDRQGGPFRQRLMAVVRKRKRVLARPRAPTCRQR
jgi:hypothetical protein